MADGRCGSCHWWTDDREHWQKAVTRLRCACPKFVHVDGGGTYINGEYVPLTVDEDGAELCDGSGYYAAICPASEFGCIHWKQREPEAQVEVDDG